MASEGRVEGVEPERLSPAQRAVFDRIAGTRGRVAGPFTVLLHSPELANRVQEVGAYLRFESELARDIVETAVLVTARVWGSTFEWDAHEPHAERAGVPRDVIDMLQADEDASDLREPYGVVTAYVRAIATSRRAPDDVYEAAREVLGTTGIVELTVLVGYYTLLAMTLGAHEID